MRHTTATIILAVGAFSLLPIWRDPAVPEPMNLWQYVKHMTTADRTHILYTEARTAARSAWDWLDME